MRFKSFVCFVLTVAIGICFAQALPIQARPFTEWVRPVEWLRPGFSSAESEAMVGRRVRCVYRTELFSAGCEIGESGSVVGVEKVSDDGYFIVVRWDISNAGRWIDSDEERLGYYGRYSSRVALGEE